MTILCDVTSPRAYVYKLKGCLKELHACEIHTNITTVVQKLIIVIIYSFLCHFCVVILFQTFAVSLVKPLKPVKARSMMVLPDTRNWFRFRKWITVSLKLKSKPFSGLSGNFMEREFLDVAYRKRISKYPAKLYFSSASSWGLRFYYL